MAERQPIEVFKQSLEVWQAGLGKGTDFFLAEAAINTEVLSMLPESADVDDFRLYWGNMGEVHASISPYLFPLTDWDSFAAEIAMQPNWGVLIRLTENYRHHPQAAQLLMEHLREWSMIISPQQEDMLLRVSDWTILKVLLEASSDEEVQAIFGPVAQFVFWQCGETDVEVITRREQKISTLPHRSPQRLSKAQYQALNIWGNRQIYRQYQDHLQAHHSETQAWDQSQFDAYLHQHVSQANQLGFSQPVDVVRYLSLTVVFGEQFTTQTWAKQVLKSPDYQGTQSRMDQLFERGLSELDKEPEQS
ncbi:DUF4123 domain-containing protein [Vibrio gazogenes]|uniref:DUF4123 domain-containing protein n=1 Tax=Vibrio gazogenes DSM 21264 = NBRC 103151 TaxID=1123492 RepID=A0A1M5A5K9_VIBGA|nr:DUF4123 domain-containing protein [Vibrio gazogenes]USP13358.1 DUF4123 domain-containing protein [Vibrio gazogenes]SHF25112.1 protein of unknown function [Vibrio gazogenes DSM 21264] [Vibrio gazogenes DSM 21264 = NBRC 103151]SJN57014.1 hypothetical protein BQ6471_02332 [Vibrio gazogenes]